MILIRACKKCWRGVGRDRYCVECNAAWVDCIGGPEDGGLWRLNAFAGCVNRRIWVNGYEYELDMNRGAYVHNGHRRRPGRD